MRPRSILVAAYANELTRSVRATVFNAWGYEVLKARNAAEALAHINASERPIDAVISDISTHGMREFAIALNAIPLCDTKLILTSDVFVNVRVEADCFLGKGYTMAELRERIRMTTIRKRGPKKHEFTHLRRSA